MKKIVPFKKELFFKNNIDELTSISLEHDIKLQNNNVSGKFIINGEYKLDNSDRNDSFNFDIPFDINIDDKYDTKSAKFDIDDFYYEIKDKNKLEVNIDILIDNIDEILVPERCIEEETPNIIEAKKEEVDIPIPELKSDETVKSLFDDLSDNETYSSYYVYIVRDGDTIDTILQKYSISKDNLELYNDLSELKLGDKIIIPTINEKI